MAFSEQRSMVKALSRVEFILIHLGMVLLCGIYGAMLLIDASHWEGWLSIFRAAFKTYGPENGLLLSQGWMRIGWAFLSAGGAIGLMVRLFITKKDFKNRIERTGAILMLTIPLVTVILVSYASGDGRVLSRTVLIQTISLIGLTAAWLGYASYIHYAPAKMQAAAEFVLNIALVATLFFIVNIFAYQHNRIFDVSSRQYYTLSSETRSLLKNLNRNVKVYVILRKDKTRKFLVYDYTEKLFNQIQDLNENISVEWLDPASPKAQTILRKYGMRAYEALIFESGKRSKAIPVTMNGIPLAVLEEDDIAHPLMNRARPDIMGYNGENICYLAINEITTDRKKEIMFIEGHGENVLNAFTPRGLSMLNEELTKLNYIVLTKRLKQGELPVADTLVIAGPQKNFQPWETELLERYLKEQNGSLVYFAEPVEKDHTITETGLSKLCAFYGIDIRNDWIIKYQQKSRNILEDISSDPDTYAYHAITKDFTNEQAYLETARSIADGRSQEPKMKPVPLFGITSSKDFLLWGETAKGKRTRKLVFDETDNAPPLNLAVLSGPREKFKTPRLAVFGDVDMTTNKLFNQGNNRALILNTLSWAVRNELVEIIPPRDYEFIKISVSDDLMAEIALLVVWSLPGFILLFGVVVLIRRST